MLDGGWWIESELKGELRKSGDIKWTTSRPALKPPPPLTPNMFHITKEPSVTASPRSPHPTIHVSCYFNVRQGEWGLGRWRVPGDVYPSYTWVEKTDRKDPLN
jgi:hypothetical protein